MATTRKLYSAHGETHDMDTWAAKLGVHRTLLLRRLQNGEPPEEAFTARDRREDLAGTELWEGARDLPWDEDRVAQRMVDCWGAMTLVEVGEVMGWTRENVRQIEARAIRKLASTCGVEVREMLRTLEAMRSRREETWPEGCDA